MTDTCRPMPTFPTARNTMSPLPERSLCPLDSIVTMDRGYNDYKLFAYWTENGIFFVTRLKDNADFTVIEERRSR